MGAQTRRPERLSPAGRGAGPRGLRQGKAPGAATVGVRVPTYGFWETQSMIMNISPRKGWGGRERADLGGLLVMQRHDPGIVGNGGRQKQLPLLSLALAF